MVTNTIIFTYLNFYNLKTSTNRRYSSSIGTCNKNKLDPHFITGFTDAEGSFIVIVRKEARNKTGWRVEARFSIGLHKRDAVLLKLIKDSLGGVGDIAPQGKDGVQYRVSSIKDIIDVIIPHFDKYPLITQKWGDFELFKRIVYMIDRKEHVTSEGLQKIVNLKTSLNLGIKDELKAHFPNTVPVSRPLVVEPEIKDPYWLSGFVSGEGCFYVGISKSSSCTLGYSVQLKFQMDQHLRDSGLMKKIINYLGCGKFYKVSGTDKGKIIVAGLKENINIIIPFFKKYPLFGVKVEDFKDFCKVSELMEKGIHLSDLEQIREIKCTMNKGRFRS